MNTPLPLALGALALGIMSNPVLATGNGNSSTSTPSASAPSTSAPTTPPSGRLDAKSLLIRSGTAASLSWEIDFPVKFADLVQISPDDALIAKEPVQMEVRVVGAAFQVGSTHTPLNLQAKVGGNSWGTVFNGPDYTVQPDQVILSRIVQPGERIDFAARASNGSNGWYSSRNTQTSNNTLIALTDGDEVPYYTPVANQGTINSFLSSYIVQGKSNNGHGNNLDGVDSSNPGKAPFVDASGTIDDEANPKFQVKLGPNEVIYLFELYATDTASSSYDAQDIVVVVTFNKVN